MNSEELYRELVEALIESPKMIDDTIHDTPSWTAGKRWYMLGMEEERR